MQNNKEIVIIGFDNNGYEVFSKLKNKKHNVKTFLYYYNNLYNQTKITDYVYYWGYKADNKMLNEGYDNISKEVLNYCNSTNPFLEENINADCYIIFYSYFDNNFIDLIDDIVRKIKNYMAYLVILFLSKAKEKMNFLEVD